jgi:hypothetical protein
VLLEGEVTEHYRDGETTGVHTANCIWRVTMLGKYLANERLQLYMEVASEVHGKPFSYCL